MRTFSHATAAATATIRAALLARLTPGTPSRWRRRRARILGLIAMAGLLTMLGSSIASASSTPPPASAARWQQAIKGLAVPGRGCFTASYPTVAWRATRCTAAPRIPYGPAPARRLHVKVPPPEMVGNGTDYSAEVSASSPLSSVTGSFDSITAGTTETGQQFGMGPQVPNTFSLQLNVKPFTTPACAGSGTPAFCQGWQQFIYSTTLNAVFMQYWLLNYTATCPAGWTPEGTFCFMNSAATALPGGALTVQQLPTVTLTGSAANGGNDSVVLTRGGNTASAVGADNVLTLAPAWTGAEWGVFGDGNGGEANFSLGTALVARTSTHNGTLTAPACVFVGWTGETNNLNLAATPTLMASSSPALVSRQTSSPAIGSCSTSHGVGDTHLATLNGMFYDFQSQGDFQMVRTDSGFTVQNRQVSGAPTWPSAAVNQAVAAQIGGDSVAVCTSPTQLEVDGQPVTLEDGEQYELPSGGGSVTLDQSGNTYLIQDISGDSVNATVNTNSALNWIDATVGLGTWPQPVTGLLANAGDSSSSIAAIDGTVLTPPFNFNEFYGLYSDGWRVPNAQDSQDLLNACGDAPSPSNPTSLFYPANLPPQVAANAKQICQADGVQDPTLLGACTIDEAVMGGSAPGVYTTLPTGLSQDKIKVVPPVNLGTVPAGPETGVGVRNPCPSGVKPTWVGGLPAADGTTTNLQAALARGPKKNRMIGVWPAPSSGTQSYTVTTACPGGQNLNGKVTVESAPAPSDVVGLGSDTTENVFDQFSANYNSSHTGAHLYGWDATNPVTGATGDSVTTKQGCTTIPRPDGSSAGITALTTENGTTGGQPCIDLALSSRARASTDPTSVTFDTLAGDAVSYATQPGSNAPAAGLTTAQLTGIYNCTITNWRQVGGRSGAIRAFLPQNGSGTRAFFLQAIGLATPGPCVSTSATQQGAAGAGASTLQENEGDAPSLNINKASVIFPYSIGKYLAERYHSASCGTTAQCFTAPTKCTPGSSQNLFGCNTRGTMVLNMINGTSPTVPFPLTKATRKAVTNPAFTATFTRFLYEVVNSPEFSLPSYLQPIFGSTGWVCTNSTAKTDLKNYGFIVLPAGTAPGDCGSLS